MTRSKTHLADHFMDDRRAVGSYVVRLWSDADDDGRMSWVDFEIHDIAGTDTSGCWYKRKGWTSGLEMVQSPDEAEPVARGFVKWDGCTQFRADVHIDHVRDLEALCAAVLMARRHAADLMGGDIGEEYRG